MKIRILLFITLFTNVLFSQNFHDTQGKLEISSSGQTSYTLPIAMPPSINDVGPVINLAYASGQNSGIAGQGWNISSIASIARTATRKDIDGYRDGVDFDADDKLSLDGQRLLLKSGTGNYWADNSQYETEVQSNSKIELKGSGTTMYFIVTSPDGSKTWYGNYDGMNATDATAFYVVRFEDAAGNFMTYHYTKPFNKSLCIKEIRFSANTNTNTTPLNKIVFTYEQAKRTESGYIKGIKIERVELLKEIEVLTNNLTFKKYKITHVEDSQLGYQRVSKLQEFNGAGEASNPIEFEYDSTVSTNQGSETVKTYYNNISFANSKITGDFDGDGYMDFVAHNGIYTKVFNSNSGGNPFIFAPGGTDRQKFVATTLSNNKLNQKQSIVYANESIDNVEFKIYNLESNGVINSYNKTIAMYNVGYCNDACTQLQYDENGEVLTGPGYPVSKCTSPTFTKNTNNLNSINKRQLIG